MIRAATFADLPALTACAVDFFQRCPDYPQPTAARLGEFLTAALTSGFVVICDRNRTVHGSIAIARRRWDWCEAEYLSERWIHAAEPGATAELLHAACALADRIGLPLYVGSLRGERALALARLYRRSGFALAGASLVYRPA